MKDFKKNMIKRYKKQVTLFIMYKRRYGNSWNLFSWTQASAVIHFKRNFFGPRFDVFLRWFLLNRKWKRFTGEKIKRKLMKTKLKKKKKTRKTKDTKKRQKTKMKQAAPR